MSFFPAFVPVVNFLISRLPGYRSTSKLSESEEEAEPIISLARKRRPSASAFYDLLEQADTRSSLDEPTWNDLQLDELSGLLSSSGSVAAHSAIYLQLRTHNLDASDSQRSVRLRFFIENPERRLEAHAALCLLKRLEASAYADLKGFYPPPAHLWEKFINWIPLLLPLGVLVSIFSPVGYGVVIAYIGSVILCQTRLYAEEIFGEKIEAITGIVLSSTEAVCAGSFPNSDRLSALKMMRQTARQLQSKLKRSWILDGLPEIKEYCNWLFLVNLRHYTKTKDLIVEHKDLITSCLFSLGFVESDLVIADYLTERSDYTWADWQLFPNLSFSGMSHPFLVESSPISMSFATKGILVTGQNGSGKSTALRTLGLNLVCAQTFGFCFAVSATVCNCGVGSSIDRLDSLETGKSLYVAEVVRAKTLLLSGTDSSPFLFLFDEIFSGTNHIESIAIACCFLEDLSQNNFVVASTHNLELAQLMNDRFTLMRSVVSRNEGARYSLEAGVVDTPNGISILEDLGFSEEFSERSRYVQKQLLSRSFSELGQVLNDQLRS